MDRIYSFSTQAKHFHLYRHDAELKKHSAYKAAKQGDNESAFELVWDLASDFLMSLKGKFSADAVYVSPFAKIVLCNAGRSDEFIPSKKTLRLLKERFGNEINEIFGIRTDALTTNEANYLIGFRSTDEIRNRLIKAKKETTERLRSKGIQRPDTGQGFVAS